MKDNIKVLYLYSGTRKDKFCGKVGIDYPDTQFYGLNYLSQFGIEADYKEFSDFIKNKFLNKFLGFRTKHLLLYFLTNSYNVVFGSSLLFMMIFKKIFKPKTKFVLLNIGFTRMVSANKDNKLKLKLIEWLVKELDGIVCLSNTQKQHLQNKFPELKKKIFFVPLGVDKIFYKPNYKDRMNYILSVGRDNGRDYKTVIDVARLMPKEEFYIVCSKRNLKEITNIPSNVKFFYDLPFIEVNKKYQEAKLLLLITHNDNFLDGSDCSGQTVLLDAMASGLPVIATKKRYLDDYIENNNEILTVDFYNTNSIKEKITILNNDNKLYFKLAKNARKKVEKDFSTKNMAKNLAFVFSLVKNKN